MALPGQVSVGSNAKILINGATTVTGVPASATAVLFMEAKGFKAYTFQVHMTGVATVTIYGTLDPALANVDPGLLGSARASSVAINWDQLGAGTTNSGFFSVSSPVIAVAGAVTSWTSGTVYCYGFAVP